MSVTVTRHRITFTLLALSIQLTSIVTSFGNDVFDPGQAYTCERSHPAEIEAELQFVITAPYKTKLLKVWIPVPPTDVAQQLLSSEFTTFPSSIDPVLATESLHR